MLTADAIERLRRHSWPGNVRELRNAIERAVVLVRGNVIDAADLGLAAADGQLADSVADLPAAVAQLESNMIRRTLEACGGNRTEAARRLNINRQLLYSKMQRYGLVAAEPSDKTTPAVSNPDT